MFKITQDWISDGEAVGTIGPGGLSADSIAGFNSEIAQGSTDVKRFRMYDDDGNCYYEGLYRPSAGSDEFQPLDCFGMPNAGCTAIAYRGQRIIRHGEAFAALQAILKKGLEPNTGIRHASLIPLVSYMNERGTWEFV